MINISGNALITKEININLVRRALKSKGQATKGQLAEITGLSTVTIGTILQALIKQSEVLEIELSPSSGGRPSRQFKYNTDFSFVLILFIHETNISPMINSTVVNLAGEIIYKTDTKVEKVDLLSFEKIIDEMLVSYPSIQAIGIGLPGTESEGKMIVSDYKSLLGVSITEHFSTRYQMPTVMENDVNAAVIGFCKRKQLKEDNTVVYIYFPECYPPGAGILINGKLYKGKKNFAGEVSYMPLGISWVEPDLYASSEILCDTISKLIIGISSVINPDIVALHGKFFNNSHAETIIEKCSLQLPKSVIPNILLSEDLTIDYLNGMIVQTLETLESDIVLSRNSK